MHLAFLDWAVIAAYAVAIITIGLRAGRKQHTSEGYFLAGRRLRWPFIGASIYAANISTEHFVGLAGSGYATGIAFGCFEWIAVFCLIPLIVLFLPFYIKNRIYTVPEFLERRFGPGVRLAFSGFMIVLSVLAKISISLWAASLVFHDVLGWNQTAVIWTVGFLTALYTMKGGLSAVVFTDAIQTTVLIVAAVVMTGLGLYHVGGYEALRAKLDPSMFSMVKPATDPDLPWPGVFFGVFLLGSFYFSMDQVLVQRVFAAKNLNEGRLGATFCAFLKTLNPIILVGPGIIAAALYPKLAQADLAYSTMLKNLMPVGLLGLTIAGITAAFMGHLSATYNSIATLVTRDFYLKLVPGASQDRQILVGRIAVLVVFALGAAWAPLIGLSKSMFVYLQNVQAYLMIPLAGVFFFAVFWKRINAPGVLACMATIIPLAPLFMLNSESIKSHDAAVATARQIIEGQFAVGQDAAAAAKAAGEFLENASRVLPVLTDSTPLKSASEAVAEAKSREKTPERSALIPVAQATLAAAAASPRAGFLPLMDHPYLRPWLHCAMIEGLICMVVLVSVSLCTAPPPPEKLKNTTVSSLWGEEARQMQPDPMMAPETRWYRDYRLWMSIVSIGTAVAWYMVR